MLYLSLSIYIYIYTIKGTCMLSAFGTLALDFCGADIMI